MHTVSFYNTLTRQIEEFKPHDNNEFKIYCCGPTVYNYPHIGNLRIYIIEDILVKTLKLAGYKVKHAMNITDVGHLTSDADDGEDKMLVAAKREHKGVLDIARMYEDAFFRYTKSLNLNKPDIVCRATEHIQDMIDFVKDLENKGYAYIANGNVYFDTEKFKNYGKLSGQNRRDLKHGARVDQDENKRNPSDFVLWFTSSKFENQILQWDSPWGKGYPGWHIECSTMAKKYLGEYLDIHCGGIDHIPVHHENEIAQSEACIGHQWVKHWIHGDFLVMKDGSKMSKSSGEFLTLDVLTDKGYKPEHYKYFTLMSHYKSQAIFNFEALDGAKNAYENLVKQIKELKKQNNSIKDNPTILNNFIEKFDNFLFNDLKTPQALATMWETLKSNELSNNDKLQFISHIDTVFGLSLQKIIDNTDTNTTIELTDEIKQLLSERTIARQNKDWTKSDEIRNKLEQLKIRVKDLPNNQIEIIKID